MTRALVCWLSARYAVGASVGLRAQFLHRGALRRPLAHGGYHTAVEGEHTDGGRPGLLLLLNAFWNYGRGMSGGDQVLIQIFRRLRPEFGRVVCHTSPDGCAAISAKAGAIDFRTSPASFDRLPLPVNYALRTRRALSCVRDPGFSVVYAGSDFFPDVIPAHAYRRRHAASRWLQSVFHLYPPWRSRPGSRVRGAVAEYLQRFSLRLARRADGVLCINPGVRDALVRMGFDARRVDVVPLGIDDAWLQALPPASGTSFDGVFLGRLMPSKGVGDLAAIWSLVTADIPGARLCVIGGGGELQVGELKGQIERAGLSDRVALTGYLDDEAAFSIVKAARVFLFPSHEEGFGIAVAEAMGCGVPVVSWDLPVYRSIFEDRTIRAREGDLAAFASAVVRLLRDDAGRREAGERGRVFATARYSWDRSAEHVRTLIRRVTSDGVARPAQTGGIR